MRLFVSLLCSATLLFFLGVMSAFAQDDKLEELGFEEGTYEEEKPPYFAVGGGYIGTFQVMNFDQINLIAKNFGVSDFVGGIFCSGVGGIAPVLIVKNLRVTVSGYSGSITRDAKTFDTTLKSDINLNMSVTSSVNSFGLDYAFQPFKGLAVLPGASFGWGSLTIERAKTSGAVEYTTGTAQAGTQSLNKLGANYLFVHPNLNLEYAVTQFAMIRVSAGYMLSFMGDWEMNGIAKVNNVPKELNSNALTLQFGVFVGLFN